MDRPLNNVKVVVTRAKEQAGEFGALLEAKGAEVVYFPTIEFKEPDDSSVIDYALQRLIKDKDAYDWIIFTSANGVRFFFKKLETLSLDKSTISYTKIGVVGPKTASALRKLGVEVDIIPEDYRAEGLIDGLLKEGIAGKRILLPRALYGRDVLPDTLNESGAEVTIAPVYETVVPNGLDTAGLIKLFGEDGDIILTFTSGSTVKNFFKLFDDDQIGSFIDRVKIAVISPVTAEVVERLGYRVDFIPKVYTAKDLAECLIASPD